MTLRGNGSGGLISSGGKLVSGESDCCCCKCCWCYSGDEKMVGGLPGGNFMEIGDWTLEITDSTLITGSDAGNFCEVKFLLNITVTDGLGELDPCDTTGTAELICDCALCPDDVFWEFRLEDCVDYDLPDTFWMGDGCKDASCDDPNCSNCSDYPEIGAGAVVVSDPDGSVRCQCPGDYCTDGEEI